MHWFFWQDVISPTKKAFTLKKLCAEILTQCCWWYVYDSAAGAAGDSAAGDMCMSLISQSVRCILHWWEKKWTCRQESIMAKSVLLKLGMAGLGK